jgi:uncharacterized protein involved in exopolysaccharide biosynthesis
MVDQNGNSEFGRDPAAETEPEGIDLEHIKEMVGFALHAGGRRPKLAAMTFLAVAALGLAAAVTMPKVYSAQVKILAQRTGAIRALSNPNSEMNRVDDPTKNVANMIMRHDNLVALAKEANLVAWFEESRAPILRLKDRLSMWMSGPVSDEDKLRVIVATLEKELDIFTDENTLVITVEWPSAPMAYDLVTLLQKNFLEARYDSDLAVITDSIAVLQEHAKSEQAQVDTALTEYQEAVAPAADMAAARLSMPQTGIAGTPRQEAPSAIASPAPNLALEETRLRIQALEQERQRLLDSLQQQLAQAQLTLTPMHPTVVALQQRLDTMSQPSQELRRLKSEERSLVEQAERSAPAPPSSAGASSPLPRVQRAPLAAEATPTRLRSALPPWAAPEDGHTRLARSKLEAAIQSSEAAMARIEAANIELDITRTAYKYRYTVLTPAELPSKPKRPLSQIVGVGAVLGAVLLAFLVATMADILGGRILEPWQVRRRLKLEVLGEIDRST